ncbi:hypothetical protein GBA52_006519 [Prunus armeniaca]|nr:hypothetical protein GBA52_006519 [Prunus armeniaca]
MAPDKPAELWTVDPKRAKRILANRQSVASGQKERKARYISELERKSSDPTNRSYYPICTTHSVPDTTGLSTENSELKLRVQAMEQQAQLRDALNDALKKELERLKIATGEVLTHTDSYNMECTKFHIQESYFLFPVSHKRGSVIPRTFYMPQFHPFQPNMSAPHQPMLSAAQSHACSDMLQQDSIGDFRACLTSVTEVLI